MDIKNIILRLNNDIQLNYGTREIFCQKNGFDYKSMTAMFSRVLSKNQNPRIDMVEKYANALGYELALVKKQPQKKPKIIDM